MTNQFKIFDWAGNDLSSYHGTFKTFEDAWDYILGEMTDELNLIEEDYQEYYVENGQVRESRYLDPHDVRSNLKIDNNS